MDFTVIQIGDKISPKGNRTVKIQHKEEAVPVSTIFGTVMKNKSITYYIGVDAKNVTVNVGDVVPVNIDDYVIRENEFPYTDEETGEEKIAILKWLYLK